MQNEINQLVRRSFMFHYRVFAADSHGQVVAECRDLSQNAAACRNSRDLSQTVANRLTLVKLAERSVRVSQNCSANPLTN
jgi:hypothetical protein